MKDARDPAIKLFGKEIPVPENGGISEISGGNENGKPYHDRRSAITACLGDKKMRKTGDEDQGKEKSELEANNKHSVGGGGGGSTKSKQDKSSPAHSDEPTKPEPLSESEDNPKTPSIDEENANSKSSNTETDQNDTNNPENPLLKKPDKILPCPRCNSMDTKFCYYNNYNINQPRHFCKSCQRYWTAGGTMRNVPVGAGRRKNKKADSHCHHIIIPDMLRAKIDASNGIHYPALKTNATVLSFGPEMPLCEPVAPVLNLGEKRVPNGLPIACNGGENGDDCSSGCSVTTSNSGGVRNEISSQIPCLPVIPWPFPWNSAIPVSPAFSPHGVPIPFYPAPYWNCSVPNNWNVPWFSPPSNAPNSTALGKHSREGDLIRPSNTDLEAKVHVEENKSENAILIPKTLRIDDPDEAARSSIWATLGIKNDCVARGSLFKAFQLKDEKKNHKFEISPALRANPAAFSRSLGFQEST